MQVLVRLYAGLEKYVHNYDITKGITVELSENATVREMIKKIHLPEKKVMLIAVNGKKRNLNYKLKPGDHIGCFLLIAGG